MKINRNIEKDSLNIREIIHNYGHLSQHNYWFYLNYAMPGEKPIFFDFSDRGGILAYEKGKTLRILTDPVSSPQKKLAVITELLEWALKQENFDKVILEDITESLKEEIFKEAKGLGFKTIKPSYVFTWPLIELKNWNEKLESKIWKRMRNMRNKFFKNNEAQFKSVAQVNKSDLVDLILKWKKQRKNSDRVYLKQYLNFIEDGFRGFDFSRVILINGRPVSVNAGWAIPNSSDYYSCVGIYDYDCSDIGEVSYLDELAELKKKGYQKVDLGGSEKSLLAFKLKFHPNLFYTTYTFSIF
ncbi:MAG: hypothetical protein A2445_04510 [Candidatus Jacksonbacteria bacterium RIFOXYC2_FULL_44_29]|nr:MAG: hypothetical protein UV19_C0003G0025 [Parcubacteria group bacterium GW2011_GWA2_42_28]KKT55844.1 MAG: hypothetical protein UW45_C0004G0025 [Parcubacteria group bacterium GW2011_GWC2_44_22]OGY75622.1 MAG: hypothetical protein A2240_03700 [Candidatus Jacksonbacteria bacterium RIFOXYA2_FULL_43_12]OGY76595.1 MAG: hypothetical protein A2295_01440 [Candidatus Jacksonbacteria bacterium RIFOXYB2_FULL_44_15]OGY78320.1 MAG: hypothetical protein A2445_04510 [Candidatus Jacksonbacteria bacterium RI